VSEVGSALVGLWRLLAINLCRYNWANLELLTGIADMIVIS